MNTYRGRAIASLIGLLLLGPATSASAVDVTGLTHLDGSEVAASELPDSAIVIFFATWSPKCRGIVAQVNEIEREWSATAPVYLVNFQEDRAAVEKFLDGKSTKVKVLLDRRAVFSKAHSITSLPGLLAIKSGTPAFRGKLSADAGPVLRSVYE